MWVVLDNVYQQFTYPEGYALIIRDPVRNYWLDPIKYIAPPERCCYQKEPYHWATYDPKHPQCFQCGRFVKAGDWWKGKYTGNCTVCYERIRPW